MCTVQSQRWSNEGVNYQTGRRRIIYLLYTTPPGMTRDLYNNGGQQEEIACVSWVQTSGH